MKHPNAPHILGSKVDKSGVLTKYETNELLSNRLVFQEKLDGCPVQMYVTKLGDVSVHQKGRAVPKNERFKQLYSWISRNEGLIINYISTDLIVFGEWMADRNIVFYNKLPDFFIVCDVYEKESGTYLSTERIEQLCSLLNIHTAPVIRQGVYDIDNIKRMAQSESCFGDDVVEGIYIRMEDEYKVIDRAQYIYPGEVRRSKKKNVKNLVSKS